MTNLVQFSNLTLESQEALNHVQYNKSSYESAKAIVKAFESAQKTLKTELSSYTDQGESVRLFNANSEAVAEVKSSKSTTAKNFSLNVKALYAMWKNAGARTQLSRLFKLTFVPTEGYSEKAIEKAEKLAIDLQVQNAGGLARKNTPERIFNRVSETFRVTFKTL